MGGDSSYLEVHQDRCCLDISSGSTPWTNRSVSATRLETERRTIAASTCPGAGRGQQASTALALSLFISNPGEAVPRLFVCERMPAIVPTSSLWTSVGPPGDMSHDSRLAQTTQTHVRCSMRVVKTTSVVLHLRICGHHHSSWCSLVPLRGA
ncbi:hypothetical protein OH76DRAFT_1067691 [Lentinus brumalis]|uniref:Uncharacterized protein n=1 Tax=Lentinus brumalis TaxID=2498619 RepID=A0A371DNN4_9APHY|nr:hypothetical protein OH76DRAFT_1067691 [Polyporus brumalis]